MSKKLSNYKFNNNNNNNNKTFQELLTPEKIKEYLKNYKIVNDIKKVNINTHIRYFTTDNKTNKKLFRLGGNLIEIGSNGQYIKLSNGTLSWSVQLENTIFYEKMTEEEYLEELKEELRETIITEMTENNDNNNNNIKILENKNKSLKLENEKLQSLLEQKTQDYNKLLKKYNLLNTQIKDIEKEILAKKNKKI